jgi:tetratricopeptide (TPR) repeat protein
MTKDNLRKMLVCVALVLGTALLYAPALHFDFVNYDDPTYIIDNYHIRALSRQSLAWCFQLGYASLWHPLTWMSHLLDFQLYGLHPGGHHATSVLLHILNSMLLFLVLDRMTKAFWPSAMVAALFAWHPLHVESVAWISERKDVLSAFFWMLAIWAYVRYAEEFKIQNSKFKIFYALALFFFALGLMAKPMVVTLPFVLLLLDWWPLRRIQFSPLNLNPNPNLNPHTLRLLLEKIPFLVLSLLACVMTFKAAGHLVQPLSQFPFLPRVINALLSYLRYVEKMVWPTNLVVIYPLSFHWSGMEVIMAGLFFAVVSVAAVRLWKARPFWLVGWLLYVGMLIPVIGLVQLGISPMGDHYTYLPSIGIFMIICWEASDIARGWRQGRAILGTLAALALGACLVLSSKQLEYWRNPLTLFSHNLKVMPDNYAAHADYAAFLRDAAQLEPARAECETAIRLAPNYAWAHEVLGGVLLLEDKYGEADAELRTALQLSPGRAGIHLALSQVALARNLPVEAAAQCEAMLATDPSNPQAHVELGKALAMQGKLDDARAQYAEALRLTPQFPEAHYQLALALASQHNTAEAVSHYRMTLELFPDNTDALNNLAWILATDNHAENRNGADAVKFASAACNLTQGKDPLLLETLAASYAEAGNFDQAIVMAQRAHDLAVVQGKTNLTARSLQSLEIFRLHQPYRE